MGLKKKTQKSRNKIEALKTLAQYNLGYRECCGYHMKVYHNQKVVDFWPTTHKWYSFVDNQKGSDLKSLLSYLKLI